MKCEPAANEPAFRAAADLAQTWLSGNPDLGLASSCTVDHEVRSVLPMALQKHLALQEKAGQPHHAAPMPDATQSYWILDLPLPIQVDARRFRCRTCAANCHKPGTGRYYYPVGLADVLAAFPDVLMHRADKQGTILMTRPWLLHFLQLFYDRLNSAATRRALMEQICASAVALRVAGRMSEFCSAVPRCHGLRSLMLTALEDYTRTAVRAMQKHSNVYSGSIVRGDGNHDIAKRIQVHVEGDGPQRPFSVLLAWVTIDGALFQPVTPSCTEDLTNLLPDLDGLVTALKTDRSEAGLGIQASAPVAHATDSYNKHRLQLQAFYKKKYPELDLAVDAATPKADAAGGRTCCAASPTVICGDPLHDCLALQRRVSATSPDASCLIHDHKDVMARLSQPAKRFSQQFPQPEPLDATCHDLLQKLVELCHSSAAQILQEDTDRTRAVAAFLQQPHMDGCPTTWKQVFGAWPP